MRTVGFLLLLLIAVGAYVAVPGSLPPNKVAAPYRSDLPFLRADPVAPLAAIYVEDWSRAPTRFGPQVIVAVWQNGHIVWSRDLLRGGPPYLTGTVTPQKVQAVLNTLEAKGAFRNLARNDSHVAPDSIFTVIAVAAAERRTHMASMHELVERRLNDRERAALLAALPLRERLFRWNWSLVRKSLRSLIPARGQADGSLRFEFRRAS